MNFLLAAIATMFSFTNEPSLDAYAEALKTTPGHEAFIIENQGEEIDIFNQGNNEKPIYIVDKDCLIDLIIAGGY